MNVDALRAQMEVPGLAPDAVQQIQQFNSDLKNNNLDQSQVGPAFQALAAAYAKDQKNSPLANTVFRAVNNLFRRILLQQLELECAAAVLNVLVDRLTPSGFVGHSQLEFDRNSDAARAALTLKDVFRKQPELVEAAVIQGGLGHPEGEVRCGSLLLIEALQQDPMANTQELKRAAVTLLNDSDPAVQRCACDVLKSCGHSVVGDIQLLDASNKLVGELLSVFVPVQQQQSTLITKIIENPQYQIQSVQAEDVQNVHAFREICQAMPPIFMDKETENNWELRERAINRLRALVRGNILNFPGDVAAMLKVLQHEVRTACLSLRTSLSMAGIQLIKDCSQLLKSYLDPLAEFMLQTLCRVLASQKKITASAAHITACSIILNCSLSMKTLGVVHAQLASQLEFARECALNWLQILIVVHSPEIADMVVSTKNLEMVAADVLKGLKDPKVGVREAARSVFWLFATCWPTRAEQLGKSLDAQQKKALLRTQPKEMFESYDHNFELHVKGAPASRVSVRTPNASSTGPTFRSVQSLRGGQPREAVARPASRSVSAAGARPVNAARAASRSASTASRSVSRSATPAAEAPAEAAPAAAPSHLMHPDPQKQNLIAQRHLTDIVRRLSRSLSEEKPLDHPPLEAHPVNIPPHEPQFIDAMPEEEDAHSDMDETEVPGVKGGAEGRAEGEPEAEGGAQPGAQLDAVPALSKPTIQQSFLTSYLESAQEAVRELLDAEPVNFDSSVFDPVDIHDSDQFKDALRAQLAKIPTVQISVEDVAAKTAQKMQPKFEQYTAEYPESREAIEAAAKLVEAAARGENPDEAMSGAVAELNKTFKDGSDTGDRVNSLAELLDSDDIDTMTMGVHALSYLLKGKKPPSEAFGALGTLAVPPPDLIGKALTYLFEQSMDQNPQIKEVIERYASSDLVAITLSYVGHALVMYVAVHMLPVEALVLTMQAIQPLLNIGTIIDTLFEIANADDVSEAALIALGGVLMGFDKIPMSPLIRDKAKAALEVIYRLGDLSSDVTAFLADWIGFDSDSDSDSDDDSDDEKIASKHAQRFERHMAARAPSSVAEAVALRASAADLDEAMDGVALNAQLPENGEAETKGAIQGEGATQGDDGANGSTQADPKNDPEVPGDSDSTSAMTDDPPISAAPISSLHPVSVSFRPQSGTKAVRRAKVTNTSSLDAEDVDEIIAEFPPSEAACFSLFDELCSKLADRSITKQGLIRLIFLAEPTSTSAQPATQPATQLWLKYPPFQERVNRALPGYLLAPIGDVELVLALKMLSAFLSTGQYTDSVEQLKVLEALCAVSGRDLPVAVRYASLPNARNALLQMWNEQFLDFLVSIFDTSDALSARVFAINSIRRVIEQRPQISPALLSLVQRAVKDPESAVRKEAYPVLLTIHNQSEAASAAIRKDLDQGQLRMFEYYRDNCD